MRLDAQQVQLSAYAVTDLIARRGLAGQPIPRQFFPFLDQLRASANGSKSVAAEGESETDKVGDRLIDSSEAAAILECSDRWIREITSDLDGEKVSGRWVFRRSAVIEYAQLKGGNVDERDGLPPTRGRTVPPRVA